MIRRDINRQAGKRRVVCDIRIGTIDDVRRNLNRRNSRCQQ
ncbi:Uncharacterised protein [Vibrio cholerae]|nr:Uncharacterised protein [Vibrio cholerae]